MSWRDGFHQAVKDYLENRNSRPVAPEPYFTRDEDPKEALLEIGEAIADGRLPVTAEYSLDKDGENVTDMKINIVHTNIRVEFSILEEEK